MSLNAALDSWQQWQVETTLLARPRLVGTLRAGHHNAISQVVAETLSGPRLFVVRSANADSLALAPDIALEARYQALAATVYRAPALRYVCVELGTLVMDYIDSGSSLPIGPGTNRQAIDEPERCHHENTGQPGGDGDPRLSNINVQSLSELINAIHTITPAEQPLDLHTQLARYTTLAYQRGVSKTALIDPDHPSLKRALALLAEDNQVLCHNDLHDANLLHNGRQLIAIDWEYAGIGSAYIDIVSAVEGCTDIDEHQLIQLTLGATFSPRKWRCAQAVYAALEWNWYQASGIPKPATCTFDKVAARLAALV